MNKIHVTSKHSGKMQGMISINTSAIGNKFCVSRTDGICKSCYAKAGEKCRPTMQRKFLQNNALLSDSVLPLSELPKLRIFNSAIFRFHAYGELLNKNHYINFVNICMLNPDITFALWTKRPELIIADIKPANLILIFSETDLNVENPVVPVGFDKVFAVYTAKYVRENGTALNCHAKNCSECRLCYTHNDTAIIKEKRK